MTTFTTLSSGALAVGQPLTSTIALAFRDNLLSVAEGDASAPKIMFPALDATTVAALAPTVYLGAMVTTSGSSVALGSLDLTGYSFITMVLNNVGRSSAGGTCGIGSATNIINPLALVFGEISIELNTGLATAMTSDAGGGDGKIRIGQTGYSGATTSVSINTSGTFTSGGVRVYGRK